MNNERENSVIEPNINVVQQEPVVNVIQQTPVVPEPTINVVPETPVIPEPTVNVVQQRQVNQEPVVNVMPQTPVVPEPTVNVVKPSPVVNPVINNTEVQNPNVGIPSEEVKVEPPKENNNNNNEGKGKTILLILFMLFAIVFVLFLPEISNFINNKKNFEFNSEVSDGTLKCLRTYDSDAKETNYEYFFKFINKGVTTGTYTTTYEDEDKQNVIEKNNKCNEIKAISDSISGVDVSCNYTENIQTTIQENNFMQIKSGKMSAFTEAGGIYPEYKYKDNIYNIEANLVKAGYDCKITAN